MLLVLTEKQTQLWAALSRMQFDPPTAAIQFIDKLIRETGWTRSFALRATEEYRKFLLIAATVDHGVSPSVVVDQVWHTHILYTRHYWQMCREILGFEFHHEPAVGTTEDRGKLGDAYAQTLAKYQAIFGEIPADIWPTKPARDPFVRVDSKRNIILPRNLAAGAAILLIAVIVLLVLWRT